MLEAARTSETLVNFYQTTRRYNPEDSHLRKLELLNYLLSVVLSPRICVLDWLIIGLYNDAVSTLMLYIIE
jgi:hypothetical protein